MCEGVQHVWAIRTMTQFCLLFAVQQFLWRKLGHSPGLGVRVSTGMDAFLNVSMEDFFLTCSLHILHMVISISAKIHGTCATKVISSRLETGEPTEEMPCVVLQAFCRKITVSRTTHAGVTDAVVQRQTLVRPLSQQFPCSAFIPSSYFFFFYFRHTTLIFHKRMKNKLLLTGQRRLRTNAFDWEKYFFIMPLWCRLSLLHWFSKHFLLQKEDTNHYSLS